MWGSSGAFPPRSFGTSFSSAPESPISEGGVWRHTSNPWANIATVGSPNRAVGTQTGTPSSNFNDSYAYLSGFGPNVSAQATIYRDPTIDTATFGMHEVELLFRMADNATQARGYECNFSHTGSYAQIGRWNGDLGDFTGLSTVFPSSSPVTGNVFKATITLSIIGGVPTNTITTYIDFGSGFVQLAQVTDTMWTDGQPGIGMWLQDSSQFANQPKFGFSSYSVTE